MYKYFFIFLLYATPFVGHANFDVGAWVPWFADETGAKSAIENIDEIDVL